MFFSIDLTALITEFNRPDVFYKSLEQIKKYIPAGAKLVIVDDGSTKPVPEATYRFNANQGIATAKNKCLELLYLSGCEHIFLFDSDTYPLKQGWEIPYIESPEPHLNYIFKDFASGGKLNDTQVVYKDSKHIAYSHVRGCMMYYHRSVLDKVGGMAADVFGRWGYEHPDLSNRIFMNGLTSFRYMDVVGSSELIHSGDEYREVKTTVGGAERMKCIAQNKAIYESRLFSKDYVPFIEKENVLLTCYFTGVVDTQRGKKWEADHDQLLPLIKSLKNTRLVVLHDCFDLTNTDKVEYVKVDTSLNPYIQRWISYREYLMRNKDRIDRVVCIDATDVEVLREPEWDLFDEFIYTGDEDEILSCPWMLNNHKNFESFIKANAHLQVLNAGIVGGRVDLIIEFIRQMTDYYGLTQNIGKTDMALFNYIARTNWVGKIKTGRQVCTLFKGEERNKVSWFKHK